MFGKTDASGEPMEIFIDGENIVLRRYEEIQTCKYKSLEIETRVFLETERRNKCYVYTIK